MYRRRGTKSRSITACMVCMLGMVLAAQAEDVSGIRAEIARLKEKVQAMQAARAASATNLGDAKSILTLRKKGAVQIGGRFDVDLYSINRDDRTSGSDTVNSTEFTTTTAALFFKINASRNTYLRIKLDVDDFWNEGRANQDDLLEEVYFMWQNVRGSTWNLKFGKAEIPYGLDKDPAITKSYHHNSGFGCASYLGNAREQRDANDTARNPHSTVGNSRHPGEHDNLYLIQAEYKFRDLFKAELALFQNGAPASPGGGRQTRGMYEDRSDDNMLFNSFDARFTLTPVENLELRFSVVNEHSASMGDGSLRTALAGTDTWALPAGRESDASANQTAIDFAFDWKLKSMKLELFGEYQHAWDWRYDEQYSLDIASLGAIYGLTDHVDMVLIGEWLGIDAGNNQALHGWDNDEDYYKTTIAGRYTFDNRIQLRLEYTKEWYFNDRAGDDQRDADVVAFRTMWVF